MSHGEQVAALKDLERLEPRTFNAFRDLTMLGMFAHPEHGGNYQKIGWKLIDCDYFQFSYDPAVTRTRFLGGLRGRARTVAYRELRG